MKVTNRDILNNIVANTGRFFLTLKSLDINHETKRATAILDRDSLCCGYNLYGVDNIEAIPLEEYTQVERERPHQMLISHGYAIHIENKILLGMRPSNIAQPNKWTVMGGRCSELPSETGIKETLEEIVIEVTNGTDFGFAYMGEDNEYHMAIAETAINEVEYSKRARSAKWIHCQLEAISDDNSFQLDVFDEESQLLDRVTSCDLFASDDGATLDVVTRVNLALPVGWKFSNAWFLENTETQEYGLKTQSEWRKAPEEKVTLWAQGVINR